MRARLRRLCPVRLREEMEGEVLAVLWMHARDARLRSVVGLITAIIHTLRGRVRRREQRLEYRPTAAFVDLPARREELAAASSWTLDEVAASLRGAREKWLFGRFANGGTCADLVAESGMPLKELHRRIARLANKLLRSELAGGSPRGEES